MGQHLDDLAESFLMSAFHNGFLRTMKANYTVQYKCCVYYKLLMVCWKLQCYINDGWISMSFFNITNGVFAVNPPLHAHGYSDGFETFSLVAAEN